MFAADCGEDQLRSCMSTAWDTWQLFGSLAFATVPLRLRVNTENYASINVFFD